MNLVTKWCKGCGKIMRDVQPNKRYCDKCLHDKNLRYSQISYQRRKAKKKSASKKCDPYIPYSVHNPKPFSLCIHECILLGMQYGEYVSKGLDREVLSL